MEMRGPGANQCGELLSSMASIAFPGPDLTDHLPLPFLDLLTRPTFPWPLSLIVDQGSQPQPQDLDNLPPLSAWPRLNGPFCWRGRSHKHARFAPEHPMQPGSFLCSLPASPAHDDHCADD